MSYDYNATLDQIKNLRQKAYTQNKNNDIDIDIDNDNDIDIEAITDLVQTFSTFSSQCPMTPLLWMYYALDFGTMVRHLNLQSEESDDHNQSDDNDKDNDKDAIMEEEQELQQGQRGKKKQQHQAPLPPPLPPPQSCEEALETESSILKLGLDAFPGCALLRLYYFDTLCTLQLMKIKIKSDEENDEEEETEEDGFAIVQDAFQDAIQHMGNGSHWNEDILLVSLYNTYIHYLLSYQLQQQHQQQIIMNNHDDEQSSDDTRRSTSTIRNLILQLFQNRANTPLMSTGANDSILQDMQQLSNNRIQSSSSSKASPLFTQQEYDSVQDGRRHAAKYYSCLANTLEKDIEVAMNQEGIYLSASSGHDDNNNGTNGSTLMRLVMDTNEMLVQSGMRTSSPTTAISNDKEETTKQLFPWNQMLKPSNQDNTTTTTTTTTLPFYLMGYGMMETTKSFIKYITSLVNYVRNQKKKMFLLQKKKKEMEEEEEEELEKKKEALDKITSLIIPLYERAISECPTVEYLWEKYIKHLLYLIQEEQPQIQEQDDGTKDKDQGQNTKLQKVQQLTAVCNRSVSNCPYSVKLYSLKMKACQVEVSVGLRVLDPEDFMNIAREAIDSKFLPSPEAHLEVYLAAVHILKNCILDVVAKVTSSNQYDFADSELMDKSGKKKKRKRKRAGNDNDDDDYDDDNPSTLDENANVTMAQIVQYSRPLPAELEQDVQDFLEDLRDMFDAIDSYLRKNFTSFTKGRAKLFLERAMIEAYILSPMIQSFQKQQQQQDDDDGMGGKTVQNKDHAIECFEKVVRVHQPPHPNAWRSYIRYLMGKSFTTISSSSDNTNYGENSVEAPGMTAAKLRYVRGLYDRAVGTVKKQKRNYNDQEGKSSEEIAVMTEFDVAFRTLCQEYIEFENMFGSDKSLANASKAIDGKMVMPVTSSIGEEPSTSVANASILGVDGTAGHDEQFQMTKLECDGDDEGSTNDEPQTKKMKSDEGPTNESANKLKTPETDEAVKPSKEEEENLPIKKTNLKVPKPKPEHTVMIGNLQYPAHPFTVHVSNLSPETEDMDLVDLFQECGTIVHARIFREKVRNKPPKQHPSKGAGLVQFEEKTSVEEALKMNGEVGLHEKLIEVKRSHQSAVNIVSPGMERARPKGEGKHSQRNKKRKERRDAAQEKCITKTADEKLNVSSKQEIVKKEKSSPSQQDKGSSTIKSKGDIEKSTNQQSSILAFRPRALGKKTRKKAISLSEKKK